MKKIFKEWYKQRKEVKQIFVKWHFVMDLTVIGWNHPPFNVQISVKRDKT